MSNERISIFYYIFSYSFYNIFLFIIINKNFISSYYILPFKNIRTSLSEIKLFNKNLTEEEIFLKYSNNMTLITLLKINNSLTFNGYLKSDSVCIQEIYDSCISNIDLNIINNLENEKTSKIFEKIIKNSKIKLDNKKCINIIIGFGTTQFNLSSQCLSFVDEIKNNDKEIKSYTWSIKYNNINNKNDYDGEIIIGIEPHEYLPSIYNESNYKTINNYIDEESFYYPEYEKNLYGIKFNSIYFYNNNNISPDNLIKCINPESMDTFLSFNIGMIQSPTEYLNLIKNNFFKKYLNQNICKEITFSYYYTYVCDKNKLDIEQFYKTFPTLYFKNIEINYIFELTSKDLFKEENNKLYFMIYSSNSVDLKWTFGEIFLKKYYFTFNRNKKLIGYYSNMIKEGENDQKNNDANKTPSIGIIILIIGILLLIINIIIGICLWQKKCGNNRRKRANELKDDNYDYLTDNSDNNKIIDDN